MAKLALYDRYTFVAAILIGLGWGWLTSMSGWGALGIWIIGSLLCPSIICAVARRFFFSHVAVVGVAMTVFLFVSSFADYAQMNALEMWRRNLWMLFVLAGIYFVVGFCIVWIARRIKT